MSKVNRNEWKSIEIKSTERPIIIQLVADLEKDAHDEREATGTGCERIEQTIDQRLEERPHVTGGDFRIQNIDQGSQRWYSIARAQVLFQAFQTGDGVVFVLATVALIFGDNIQQQSDDVDGQIAHRTRRIGTTR